jgi:nucleoside-diphosphate-sugar epimerase
VIRDPAKAEPLKEKLDKLYGPGFIEFVQVGDATKPDAFLEALKGPLPLTLIMSFTNRHGLGTSGVIHLAIDLEHSFSATPNTEKSIQAAVDMTLGILKSASKVPTIKSAVVTSSNVVHYSASYENPGDKSLEVWNEEAVKLAHALPDDHPAKGFVSYVATKVVSQQEIWKWVEQAKVRYVAVSTSSHLG